VAEAWAEVDGIKRQLAGVVASKRAAVESWRKSRAQRAARVNVERWFRELPADAVHALVVDDGCRPGCVLTDEQYMVMNDYLLERGLGEKTARPVRPPSGRELAMLRALRKCRFPPASFAKRFVRELSTTAITDGQAAQLRRLVQTFRRQIPSDTLHEDDHHLLAKAARHG
jgi:hypothetical protein